MDLTLLRQRAFDAGYRMLGTRSDAEDIAQETLLRVRAPIQRGDVTNPDAYVTTVATRLAIDQLRSARIRRESYRGPWLPEPIIEHGVEHAADVADSVSYALLVVLETLAPLERAAFLLREVFGFSYAEVGNAIERSEPATRKLVSRARHRIADRRPRLTVDPAEHRTLLERFMAAARGGDFDELLRLLAPDAVLVTDGGSQARAARRPIHGALRVARFVRKIVPKWGTDITPTTINGGAGFIVDFGGRLHAAGTIDVRDGHITAIHWILNPEKLPAA